VQLTVSAAQTAKNEDQVSAEASHPKILLLHDDELEDIRTLLHEFSFPFVERGGDPTEVDRATEWELIISSQKRLRAFKDSKTMQNARCIAVIDNDSRKLRSNASSHGVDFVLSRPVHSAALRLLILHCVYRGPEKRRQGRVSAGARVQVRSGLLWRDAILADISLRGARLVCDKPVKPGAKMNLFFPSKTGNTQCFNLTARSLRTTVATDSSEGHIVAVAFEGLSPVQGQQLRKVFETFKTGPARLERAKAHLACSPTARNSEPEERTERRATPRVKFEKHVVTVHDEATRVLLCRDISMGGMRVNPNDTLVPGDKLLVAVHIRSRAEPLLVNARVTRDDGDAGLALEFHDLSKDSADYLKKMVNLLHILGVNNISNDVSNDGPKGSLIISEIVEDSASSAPPLLGTHLHSFIQRTDHRRRKG
jgi:hypothetical protein